MIEIISDFFIRRHYLNSSRAVRRVYGMICSLSGIWLNLVLFALKLTASIFSGSVAAAVDAIHNLTDSASSAVTLLSFMLSGQKKTKKYPMGKGRIEYVAGFVVAVVLLSAGLELAKTSTTKIITPEPVTFSFLSVVMLFISFFVKLYMAMFNRRISKKISSAALKAASVDCLCDSFATLIAAFAVISVRFTNLNVDAWGGLAVSLFILYAGIKAAKDSVKMLVGIPVDDELYDDIEMMFNRDFPDVTVNSIMIHDYGPENRILDVHVTISEDCPAMFLCTVQEKLNREVIDKTGCELQTIICRGNQTNSDL